MPVPPDHMVYGPGEGVEPPDYGEYDPHEDCWLCGGEGRINTGCIDYACQDQDDPDCPYCSQRCDACKGKGWISEDDE